MASASEPGTLACSAVTKYLADVALNDAVGGDDVDARSALGVHRGGGEQAQDGGVGGGGAHVGQIEKLWNGCGEIEHRD